MPLLPSPGVKEYEDFSALITLIASAHSVSVSGNRFTPMDGGGMVDMKNQIRYLLSRFKTQGGF